MRVLVAGATGYLGRHAVREFKRRGWWVRALSRSEKGLDRVRDNIDDGFVGQVTAPEALKGACDGVDAVFTSVGITRQKDGLTYMDVDYGGNHNLLEEAKRAEVSQFLYVSAFQIEKMAQLKGAQAKLKFGEELKTSGLDYRIVYPNGFFSDILAYLDMAKKGRGYVFGSGQYRLNPIHGADLAAFCAEALKGDEKELEVGGPDVFSHNEILAMAFEMLGRRTKITRTPLWVRDALLWMLRTFTSSKTYGPPEFFMTVLAMDMVAPQYGTHRLREFFEEHVKS